MGTNTNKHGLSRDIPAGVKLKIRQNCKFGCVNCRNAIYQYAHIEPPFAEAKGHDPSRMCLLCGSCHDRERRGILSRQSIMSKYTEVLTGEDIERPSDKFDLRSDYISVKLGSAVFESPRKIITVNGNEYLSVHPPEEGSGFPTLSGRFTDENGEEIFRIERNEWIGPPGLWDMEIHGPRIVIRNAPGHVALEMKIHPPEMLEIVSMDMIVDNCHILCGEGQFFVGRLDQEKRDFYMSFDGDFFGAAVGISIDSKSVARPQLKNIWAEGRRGVFVEDTGISLGLGADMRIRRIRAWDLEGRTRVYPPE